MSLTKKELSIAKQDLKQLQEKIETCFGIPDIGTNDRSQNIIEARYIYFRLARNKEYSLDFIGKTVNRHYSTVLHGLNKHDEYMSFYARYKILFEQITISINKESNTSLQSIIAKLGLLDNTETHYVLEFLINPYLKTLHKEFV